jgi:3',5'-cyclic AMP phosphodiesterase CpdA
MTTFVHLTDLHISAPEPVDTGLHSDTTATQHAVREMIDGMATPPAFILVSGDLTNHGDLASYQSLRTMMSDLKMPVLYALGNHDTRAGFYAGMLDRAETTLASYDHEAVIEGVHVITLDTSRPDKIGGELDDAQFAFLQAALANQPGLPKILMFHHAPALVMDPDWEWECLSFAATARLAEVVKGHAIAGIFCGHIHMDRFSQWYGIPLVVGMGQHAALDPLFHGQGIRMVQGTSFSVCVLRDSGLTVTCVPLPSTRAETGRHTLADLRAYEAARATAE